jgi:hypothetical protein
MGAGNGVDSHPNDGGWRRRSKSFDWATAYCEALSATGQKKAAAKAAQVTLRAVQKRRLTDTSFAADERYAMTFAKETLEDEVFRRAVQGIERQTVDSKGNVTCVWREYSDRLLLRLLERLETGSWRQKQVLEHSQPIGAFKTEAERKEAFARAREQSGLQAPS